MPMLLHGHLLFYACKCADLCCVCVCLTGPVAWPDPDEDPDQQVVRRSPSGTLRLWGWRRWSRTAVNWTNLFSSQDNKEWTLFFDQKECVSVYLSICVSVCEDGHCSQCWSHALLVWSPATKSMWQRSLTPSVDFQPTNWAGMCQILLENTGWSKNKCCMKAMLLQAMETEYLCLLICGAAQRKSCWSR